MNKKVLVIAVALMAVAMLATPMVGTAQACRSRRSQTFEATFELRNPATTPYPGGFTPPTSTELFGPTDPAYVGPGNPEGYKYRVQKDLVAWGTIDCGPLGIGKMTATMKYWLHNFETRNGFMLLIYHLEFDGNYGDYEGTLTGNFLAKTTIEPPILYYEGYGIFHEGTGDLKGVKMTASVNTQLNFGVPMPWIAYGEMTCRIWGLP